MPSKAINRLVLKCKNIASTSTSTYKMAALAFTSNRRIVASAKSNPDIRKMCGYDSTSGHAEGLCLEQLTNIKKINRVKMIVVRVNNNNELLCSAPCTMCVFLLKKYGINRIYYVNKNGKIVLKRIADLKDGYIPSMLIYTIKNTNINHLRLPIDLYLEQKILKLP